MAAAGGGRDRGRHAGHGGDRVGLGDVVAGGGGRQAQRLRELGEERTLGAGVRAVGVDDPDRHLVGELRERGIGGERARDVGELRLAQQDLLVERGEVDALGGQACGKLLDARALALVLEAVGEGGHQRDGEHGTGLFRGHRLSSQRQGRDCSGAC